MKIGLGYICKVNHMIKQIIMANIIVLLMTNFDEKFLDAFISTIILNLAKIIPAIRHLYPTLSPLLDERTE